MFTDQQRQILHAMGITIWQQRDQTGAVANITTEERQVTQPSTRSWQALQQCVQDCQLCGLARTRKQTVFGVGDIKAELMIIGEAPGAEEDRRGEPFVGRAGQLLDAMLMSIGLSRQQVFIANILKCRPPQNRDPKEDEIATCTPYLIQQIDHIKPKLILAVGRIAAQYLLASKQSLGRLRGETHTYTAADIPLRVSYHPAYLLRSPREKRKSYQDLLAVQQFLHEV